MEQPVLSAEQMEDAYRCARMHQLRRNPFSGEYLGAFAWYYHQMLPVPSAGLYLFSSRKILLSCRSVLQEEERICALLDGVVRGRKAAFVGLSLCARRHEAPDPADEILLYRYDLYCQQLNLPVLDMILVHRDGYIPLSRMKRENVYLKDPMSGWFQ